MDTQSIISSIPWDTIIPVLFCFFSICFLVMSVAFGFCLALLADLNWLFQHIYDAYRKIKRMRKIRKVRLEREKNV